MIKITTDSTCDLPRELLERYNITVTPLGIIKAGKLYQDGVDIRTGDIAAHVDAGGDITNVGKTVVMSVVLACIFYAILLICFGYAWPWKEFAHMENPSAATASRRMIPMSIIFPSFHKNLAEGCFPFSSGRRIVAIWLIS